MSNNGVSPERPSAKTRDDESGGGPAITESAEVRGEGRVERDEFGLPVRPPRARNAVVEAEESGEGEKGNGDTKESVSRIGSGSATPAEKTAINRNPEDSGQDDPSKGAERADEQPPDGDAQEKGETKVTNGEHAASEPKAAQEKDETKVTNGEHAASEPQVANGESSKSPNVRQPSNGIVPLSPSDARTFAVSEWSHQLLGVKKKEDNGPAPLDDDWQTMPAYAPFDIYNDDGKLIAKEVDSSDEEEGVYGGRGGAGKGYTRVTLDEDAQSATSMDDNTAYLFKESGTGVVDEHDETRDALAQMQATKDLLTEGQRIAYVGLTRLAIMQMQEQQESMERTKAVKQLVDSSIESMRKWGQKMIVRLYGHMDIDPAEQIMIEQLGHHGVQPADLSPALMKTALVKNPVLEETESGRISLSSSRPSASSPVPEVEATLPQTLPTTPDPCKSPFSNNEKAQTPADALDSPPPYKEKAQDLSSSVHDLKEISHDQKIDIDIRWTVLCDLFLVLIADSVYDSRSRQLLERLGSFLDVSWVDICRFEKRVTDALEMQEAANKEENWDEAGHIEKRGQSQRNRRLALMGLATVGGGLVIGLSAGLLAPVIGAGLAAGFTTIGVAGTGSFLAGAGGAAIVTTTGVITGGTVGVRSMERRTGAVKTFEYRPLHNNKRTNLIITVSGWMTGKVDDVRLPFSTVDPLMGDIYSIHWEPEMLRSMGDTINILATEALTQSIQQILGSTILMTLMAAIQLPIILTKISYLIDNPWSNSLARAELAGLILADSLIGRNLGTRPVTLVGFSLGARVIFSCLKELADKNAFGLIQNVFLFGSPVVAKKDEYLKAKSVVSGRFVNGYSTNDWILGYLFRATGGGIMRVAGLAPVEIPGVENINVSGYVPGHMSYRGAMPKLLRKVGWRVESDEFTEIEDPDPDNHEKRQRELINEIEEARKELEKKPQKRRFGLFKTKKLTEKKNWETYDERMKADPHGAHAAKDGEGGVLFDVEAIRAEAAEIAARTELEAEGLQVKQLESTLPPMKLNLSAASSRAGSPAQHSTRGYNGNDARRPSEVGNGSTLLSRRETQSPKPSSFQNWGEYDAEVRRKSQDHHSGDGNISMTFETSYAEPPPRVSSLEPQKFDTKDVPAATAASDARTEKPLPLPVQSVEPQRHNPNPEHNAWADDGLDEFDNPKEITMTFG